MSKDRNWINSFAGLRFFVVLLLILHHFDSFNDLQIPGWSTLMLFLSEGFLSVNFFFILSGFVIEYSYGSKINTVNGISGAKFIIYRVAHLYPTYIFCLFIATFLYYGGSTAIQLIQGHDFLINLFMLQSWIPKDTYAFQFNGLAWAVSTEVFFYLTFVFLAGAKSSRLVFLNLLIWTAIIFITFTVGTNVSAPNWFYYINPVCRVAEFFLGVLLCRVYLSSDLQISVKVATALEIFAISVLLAFILLAVYFQPPGYTGGNCGMSFHVRF